ncbi:hypothetical protein B0H66DRAFT_535610 [Apodospora peruviana]|uniref:Uncharacterized protein n=1 Tax=Apodospora peruviana TaxID=516989 RepID=A0AAE0HXP7_9PEZI|nr:hypothetical protein B0H66DRAFT_535610 [Apodospora peruviana]
MYEIWWKFDDDTKSWICDRVETKFDETDITKMIRMIRIVEAGNKKPKDDQSEDHIFGITEDDLVFTHAVLDPPDLGVFAAVVAVLENHEHAHFLPTAGAAVPAHRLVEPGVAEEDALSRFRCGIGRSSGVGVRQGRCRPEPSGRALVGLSCLRGRTGREVGCSYDQADRMPDLKNVDEWARDAKYPMATKLLFAKVCSALSADEHLNVVFDMAKDLGMTWHDYMEAHALIHQEMRRELDGEEEDEEELSWDERIQRHLQRQREMPREFDGDDEAYEEEL